MAGNKQEYEKYYLFMLVFAYLVVLINTYYFAHPFYAGLGLTHKIARDVMLQLKEGGVFDGPYGTKTIALMLLVFTHVVRSGKGKKVNWWAVAGVGAAGLILYYIWPKGPAVYIITTITGFLMTSWSVATVSRNLAAFKDPNNDPLESWKQCEELIDTPDSINLRLRYKWKGKFHDGWVNVLNPYRASVIFGTPGAGKTYSVINQYITQSIRKDYCMLCYDYKYPDLSKIVYNEYRLKYPPVRNPDYSPDNGQPQWIKDPAAPSFYVINFNDARYSNRCNPIHPSYIKDPADSAEIADIVFKNIAPETVEKEDFFSRSAKLFFDAIVYFLSIYKNGKYCTFPHAVELLAADYKKVFAILASYDELETKIKPFASALEAGAQDQLQGQIASAQIPLNKMSSPALYWVMSGDDFRLDLNNPDDPKFLCIGNDPKRQSIYGTVLALYTSRVIALINAKNKRKIMLIIDELPTIFIKGLDNLIATARSNKVAVCLGVQDESQLVRDYSQKEADVILNTIANVFVGNVKGKTAEKYSKSFGREFREEQSQTLNIDSESIQRSYRQQELLQVSTIENLSRGFFFGETTDDNDHVQPIKMWYGELKVDSKAWDARRKQDQPMPRITSFGEEEIYEQCHEETMANSILRTWAIRQMIDEGILGDEEEMEIRIEALKKSLSKKERDKIIDAEARTIAEETRQKTIEENFMRIKQDIQDILDEELGEDELYEDDGQPNGTINPIEQMTA